MIYMEYRERVAALVERLGKKELDVALLFDQASIRYFTGFRLNRATSSILIVDRDGELTFIVALLDFERAKRDCWIENALHFPEDTPDYLAILREPLRGHPKRIGIEPNVLTYYQAEYLQRLCNGAVLQSVEEDLAELRAIKSAQELAAIRGAAAIADKAMDEALKRATTARGATEEEVSTYAEYVMRLEGAEGTSFEPFLMSGENAWLPQRVSSNKSLNKGELILLDMGAVYQGYCSDLTRTFSLGGLNKEQRRIFEVAYEAQQAAIEAIQPGKQAGEIDRVAREVIEEEGYGKHFPHLTGHGLGLSVHEQPVINRGVDTVLEPNMVVTVEPGIYLPGVGAARVEDMVLITETGHEVLTKMERELI